MQIDSFDIAGPLLLTPARHGDARGFFSEVFRQDRFEAAAGPVEFVQDNHSRSQRKGVVRGLHYQAPPFPQGKLVRVTRGAVWDVAVDARRGSPAVGRDRGGGRGGGDGRPGGVPPGFLHGFCTLSEDVEFLYKVTSYYSPEHDGAVAFDDPALEIDWPLQGAEPLVSDKDRRAPAFTDMPAVF